MHKGLQSIVVKVGIQFKDQSLVWKLEFSLNIRVQVGEKSIVWSLELNLEIRVQLENNSYSGDTLSLHIGHFVEF